jgi:DNA adenine methylase
MFQPVIKWSGSKRSQSSEIIKYFPKEIDTYFEPFCGGASMLYALMTSDIKVNDFICSDSNSDLINLWKYIKNDPYVLSCEYERLWKELNKDKDIARQKAFYNRIRTVFNVNRHPAHFLFLNRTCFNGLIRYNSYGEFNSPFHLNRPGIEPNKLSRIIENWSELLKKNDVTFVTCDYSYIIPIEWDFVYLDPPYANTNGMYSDEFDNKAFFKWLKTLRADWVLSYDGKSGNDDNTFDVPKELYSKHVYIKSGNSSFKRIKQSDNKAMVFESLYIKN